MRKTNKYNFWHIVKRLLVPVLLTVFLLVSLYGMNTLFLVRSVVCLTDDQQQCSQEVTQQLKEMSVGQSLFFTDYQHLASQANLVDPLIISRVSKRLPNTLIYHAKVENVSYLVESETGILKVAADGQVFAGSTQPDVNATQFQLPVVKLASESGTIDGTRVNPQQHEFLTTLAALLIDQHLSVKQIRIVSPQHVELELDDDNTYVLEMSSVVASLKKVVYIKKYLQTAQVAVDEPYVIDVRFRQPVLRSRL